MRLAQNLVTYPEIFYKDGIPIPPTPRTPPVQSQGQPCGMRTGQGWILGFWRINWGHVQQIANVEQGGIQQHGEVANRVSGIQVWWYFGN